MLRFITPLALIAAGCNSTTSSSASLQGVGSFVPTAVIAETFGIRDGGPPDSFVLFEIDDVVPVDSCAIAEHGYPDGGAAFIGSMQILVTDNGTLKTGPYAITDQVTFAASEDRPDGGLALIQLLVPTDPPSDQGFGPLYSLSGSLTLTEVGSQWAGQFSAVLMLFDGGSAPLSGSFTASSSCPIAN